jgi:hypothetical protein
VSFAAKTICVASQRGFIIVIYFVIDSVRKLLDTPSFTHILNEGIHFYFINVLSSTENKVSPHNLYKAVQLISKYVAYKQLREYTCGHGRS